MRLVTSLLLIFLAVSVGSCDRKLAEDTLTPSVQGTSQIVDSDDDWTWCGGVYTKGTNPGIPGANVVWVGYKRFYDAGTPPLACWVWGSAVYRGAFKFDLTKYTGKNILSAVLTLKLGQAEYASGSVASNEGIWIKTIGLATSNWWEQPNPSQGKLFPSKSIPGMPNLPTGLSPAAQSDFPVKYDGMNTLKIDVSTVVRNWLDGSEPNNGFVLAGTNEAIVGKSGNTALSPVQGISLGIAYTVPK